MALLYYCGIEIVKIRRKWDEAHATGPDRDGIEGDSTLAGRQPETGLAMKMTEDLVDNEP